MPKFKKMQVLTDNINRVTRENLTGLRVIRAYNAEDFQEDKFEMANEELTSTQLFTGRAMSFMMPSLSLIMSGLSLSIYWIGAYLINAAQMQDKITLFSNMIIFSSYAMQVVMSFMMLSMMFIMLPRAFVSSKRINEVLFNGINVKEYSLDALHNKIGYVPQTAVLFKGSVTSNVAYGERKQGEFTKDEVIKAVNIAQGTDFVEKMNGTYEGAISQGGSNVVYGNLKVVQ